MTPPITSNIFLNATKKEYPVYSSSATSPISFEGSIFDGEGGITCKKSSATPDDLYDKGLEEHKKDGNTKDGKIGNTKQVATGDCWLLASVTALSYSKEGQEYIKNALEYKDDYTIVHTAMGDIVVTDREMITTKGDNQYSDGDDDMIIFELAIEKILDKIATGEITLKENLPRFFEKKDDLAPTTKGYSSIKGGHPLQAFYYLTGKLGTSYENSSSNNSKIKKALDIIQNNNFNNLSATCGFKKDQIVKDVNGEEIELIYCHAYSIKKVTNDTVTVANPWDTSKEITLPKETFSNSCSDIGITNLTDESSKLNVIDSGTTSTCKDINGVKYFTESEYKNGKVVSKTIKVEDGNSAVKYDYDENGKITGFQVCTLQKGKITQSYPISSQEAQKIIDRKLLELDQTATGLGNDIYTSGLASLDDNQWKKVKKLVNNENNLQTIGKIAKLTDDEIEKTKELTEIDKDIDLDESYFLISMDKDTLEAMIEDDNVEFWSENFGDIKGKAFFKELTKLEEKHSTGEKNRILNNIVKRDFFKYITQNKLFTAGDYIWLAQLPTSKYEKACEYMDEHPNAPKLAVQAHVELF